MRVRIVDRVGLERAELGGITLRPVEPADMDFLLALYATTRADEMALVPWSAEEKAAFVRMQFDAQHRFYRERFPRASFDVIRRHGEVVGRLYVDRRADEIRVIDIALEPEHRRAGIGGALMEGILDEGAQSRRKVTIHVESNNPAMSLYRRLGFEHIRDEGVYQFMEWSPSQPQGESR